MRPGRIGRRNKNENRNFNRSSLVGTDLRCVWVKWFSEFPQHGPDADRIGRTIYRRTLFVSLLLGGGGVANHGWFVIAGEPLRAAGAGASWSSDCEHPLLSRVPEPRRCAAGNRCDSAVVRGLLWPA